MARSEAAAAVLRFLASDGEEEEEAATSAAAEARGRGGFPEQSLASADRLVIFTQIL